MGARDSPVLVNLVGHLLGDGVGLVQVAGGSDGGLVGELVLDAAAECDGLALDALETLVPAVDALERVLDALSEDLVAASHEQLAGQVATNPVEGVLAVLGLVDKLGEDFLHGFSVALSGDTKVELVRDLDVDLGLDGNGALLVVVSGGLIRTDIWQVISYSHLFTATRDRAILFEKDMCRSLNLR